MKNHLYTLLILLFFFAPIQAQDFIVKYQSQPGNIPAFLNNIIGQDDMVSQDFNFDGIPDLPAFQTNGNNPDSVSMKIFNGFGPGILFEKSFFLFPDNQGSLPIVMGYADFGNEISMGDGALSVIIKTEIPRIQFDTLPPNVTNVMAILDPNTGQSSYCCA